VFEFEWQKVLVKVEAIAATRCHAEVCNETTQKTLHMRNRQKSKTNRKSMLTDTMVTDNNTSLRADPNCKNTRL
jgi:hypothetical protein